MERFITIRVFGVSCVTWNIGFFVRLANSFGSFFKLENSNCNSNRFDCAWITLKVK